MIISFAIKPGIIPEQPAAGPLPAARGSLMLLRSYCKLNNNLRKKCKAQLNGVLADRKMKSKALAVQIGITEANLSLFKPR
jgi:hypothetical protein